MGQSNIAVDIAKRKDKHTMKNKKPKKHLLKNYVKKHKVLTVIVAILLVAAIVGGSVFAVKSKSNSSSYSFIRTTTLSKGTLDDSISATGTVTSSKSSNVTTSLQYTVKSIAVKVGDEVKKGDVIATLDTTQLEKQIATAEENIEKQEKSAKISYNSAKQSYNDAKSEYQSAKSAVETTKTALNKAKSTSNGKNTQGNSSSEYEKAKEAYENAKNTLTQAKSNLAQAKTKLEQAEDELENASDDSELEELKDNLDACTIKAGQDGTVTALNATVGSSCKDTIAKIQDTSKLAIDITIEEADINNAKVGLSCKITTDAADETYNGTLTQIDPTASDSGSFGATVTLDSTDTKLKIGINATVEIIISSTDNVYKVPIDAIGKDSTGSYVYRKTGGSGVDMTFEKVYVTTGNENDYYIEIDSDDLKDGDVIRSSADLSQGIETVENEEKSSNKFNLFGNLGSSGGDGQGGQMQQGGNTPPSGSSNQGAPSGDMNNGGGKPNE